MFESPRKYRAFDVSYRSGRTFDMKYGSSLLYILQTPKRMKYQNNVILVMSRSSKSKKMFLLGVALFSLLQTSPPRVPIRGGGMMPAISNGLCTPKLNEDPAGTFPSRTLPPSPPPPLPPPPPPWQVTVLPPTPLSYPTPFPIPTPSLFALVA